MYYNYYVFIVAFYSCKFCYFAEENKELKMWVRKCDAELDRKYNFKIMIDLTQPILGVAN